LNRTPTAQEIRVRTDKWNYYIKLQSFCISQETITGIKRQPIEWKKTFASYSTDKRLSSRIYKKTSKRKIMKLINGQMN
jgi:hypothetical protein